ncbi:DUF4344 domain-containing metallopeptidase [Corynebacterium sp.]|uniref:DUF4344 domain-containing metallopeptidase n=1 Tax=Corynebacterium sp. TaxID=1720 RepID=UPI0025BBDF0F|nr:DUF4344 domain-containing metallopeptidase [Corynebacterium sp.]
MSTAASTAASTAILALALAGCTVDRPAAAPEPGTTSATGEGSFVPVYEPALTEDTTTEAQLLRSGRVLERFSGTMNRLVTVPGEVRVTAKECGEDNAFFDPETHSIELCYELVGSERALFTSSGDASADNGTDDTDGTDRKLLASALATLYHEAGHALIWELDLPVTGREEDVADQFAAYMLTTDAGSSEDLVTVAETYALTSAENTGLEDLAFHDSHPLDEQRSVNFLCYAYGAYPHHYRHLVDSGDLPAERAEECEAEYAQLAGAWDSLLADHAA